MGNREIIDLESLNLLLTYIPDYPATSEQLAMAAKDLNAPSNVVDFFESIPGTVFESKLDIMRRSQETELLLEEEERLNEAGE